MRLARRHSAVLAVLALAACGSDPVAPRATMPAAAPSRLLAPGEWQRTLVDSTDARGTHVLVAELAAGVYADPARAAAASVIVRSAIPAAASGSKSNACITSTLDRIDTQPGWAATVKKAGGCDKEIGVALANKATGERATSRTYTGVAPRVGTTTLAMSAASATRPSPRSVRRSPRSST